jgi:hypothetical protein
MKINENFINKECMDKFIEESRVEILKVKGFEEIDKGILDTILLHIRVNLVYAIFVDWVSKVSNIKKVEEKYIVDVNNNSLVLGLAYSSLRELGVDDEIVKNLIDSVNRLNGFSFNFDFNSLS